MSKKRKKSALPKRIGGMKVPKTVRRGWKDFMSTQSGRVMAAEAVLAMGAALTGAQAKRGSATRRFMRDHDVGESTRDMAAGAMTTGSAMTYAIGEATRAFADALHRGKAEADARAAWPEETEAPRKSGKKSSSTAPEMPGAH